MKCHESLVYVASGSAVTAVDLRTMQRVTTAAVHQQKLYSFGMAPSKSLICTGGNGRYDCMQRNFVIDAKLPI
jgi:F-box/WD-40 domain protein 7